MPRSSPRPQRKVIWLRRGLFTGLALCTALVVFDRVTRITPPDLPLPRPESIRVDGETVRIGSSSLTRRGALWVMRLTGPPTEIGYRHARLATPLMAEGDRRMLELFESRVPWHPLRWLITAVARFRYRNVDRALSEARRAEIFGVANGYGDRFTAVLPTYHRMVFLHALYDIALAFEHSPLLGCTAFVASGRATRDGAAGHTIAGRNFDFDLDPWFDESKVVQIVEPEGRIAFVSVAWPGMTGVVTGMNSEGIWVSVNGARAGEPSSRGVPVVFTTRAVLEQASSLDAAIAIVKRDRPMISHMLLLADGKTGESAVVERAPGMPPGIVRHPSVTVLANHYRTAPLRDDPKDARIREQTSTLARAARMDELVQRYQGRIDPLVAASILRDRSGVDDTPLSLGHRSALDALVATHSVIADLTARVLWVSEGPHTLGRYVRVDLGSRRAKAQAAARVATVDLPPDPLLGDGGYERYLLGTRLRHEAEANRREGQLETARELYRRALGVRDDDHRAWRGLAEVEELKKDFHEAAVAWQRVLAFAPESPAEERETREHIAHMAHRGGPD